MTVVFNSSPWIFLSKLGSIEQTMDLFSKVLIPASVWEEVRGRPDEAYATLKELKELKRVRVQRVRNARLAEALGRRLGKGEAQAIALALEKQADLVILDDHVARTEAMRLGLEVKGTLGMLVFYGLVNLGGRGDPGV